MTDIKALLLITTACPHCASVLQGLSELVKSGTIGRLEVVNISTTPEIAREYGVRAVPYVRLGLFEFEGLQSPSELKYWAENIASKTGMIEYFVQSFKGGGLSKVLKVLNQDKSQFSAIFSLMQDPATELQVRVGIGAVIEEFEGSSELLEQIDNIAKLVKHPDPRVRLDACHYLALTHSPSAIPLVESLLDDEDSEVRKVAKESSEALRG